MKSLFGYGITTKEIAKSGGWEIFDDNFKEIRFDKYGNKLLPSFMFEPEKSKLEITSPGIPPTHTLIKKAKNEEQLKIINDALLMIELNIDLKAVISMVLLAFKERMLECIN